MITNEHVLNNPKQISLLKQKPRIIKFLCSKDDINLRKYLFYYVYIMKAQQMTNLKMYIYIYIFFFLNVYLKKIT